MMETLFKQICLDSINQTQYNWTLDMNSLTIEEIYQIQEEIQLCTERHIGSTTQPSDSSSALSSVGLLSTLVLYYVAVMVLGLAINIAVLSTIVRSRRLRTITNAFMCSLSLADLLMAVVVIPLKIVEYTMGLQYPDVIDTFFPLLGVASLLNLCAVTVDRYISISHALTYESRMTKPRAAAIIVGIWLLSTLQAVLQFAFKNSSAQLMLYQDFVFVFAFLVPFVSVVFTNGRILCVARKHAREISAAENCSQTRSSSRSFAKKMKIIRVLGVLVGTFVVSWLPYFILTIYENHVDSEFEVARRATEALACGTALTNALLYGLLRRDVREALIRTVRCQNLNQNEFSVAVEFTARTNSLGNTHHA